MLFFVCLSFLTGLMGIPSDSSHQSRTACSYQHSPGAGSSSGSHHHQHNHVQSSHHSHHPQQHLSPHSTHSQHQAHGQHQQLPAHSQQHPSLSHQSHTGQTCPTTGENRCFEFNCIRIGDLGLTGIFSCFVYKEKHKNNFKDSVITKNIQYVNNLNLQFVFL